MLAKSTTSPLAPKNDEVLVKVDTSAAVSTTPASAKEKNAKKKEAEASGKDMPTPAAKTAMTVIDLEGIQDRVVALPVSAGNYFGITAVEDAVYYLASSTKSPRAVLKVYNLKDKKETEIGEFNSYVISANLKKF